MTVSLKYQRNLGFLNRAEQELIQNLKVAVAGVGGDGGEIARLLVRTGVGCGTQGEIRLADPEVFEEENTNRQTACTNDTIGTNKARAVGELLQRINPDATVLVYEEGVTEANLDRFVGDADVVIDETDYTHPELAVMLHRACRARGIPIVMSMNIGFGGLVTTYLPDGPSWEKHLGFRCTETLEQVAKADVPLDRWCPYLPPYGDYGVLQQVGAGLKPAPSVAAGVSAVAATAVVELLWLAIGPQNHRPEPIAWPRAICVDPATRKTRIIRWTRTNYYLHGAVVLFKHKFGLNPTTDY